MFNLLALPLFSQEKQKAITLTGYVSSMQSIMFDSLSGPFIVDNLLHNRLNFKGYLNEHLTVAAEFRNRLFTGDIVRSNSDYSNFIGADDGFVDMSWNVADQPSFLINTTIDRLWFEADYNMFQARIGRQRINWGQTLVWNPNDIFNVYSFFDVDYVERPGSDAVRLQFFPSAVSSAELVIKLDNQNNITTAGLYRFNQWGYDVQFLAGYMNSEDLVMGAGWSGAVGAMSFRGETSWFKGVNSEIPSDDNFLFTIGLDRTFENNSMAQFQVMYASSPLEPENFLNFYYGSISAKSIAYSEFSAMGQFTWAVTPLMNLGLSAMWLPDLEGYYAGPAFDYSLAENVDFSLIWQHFSSVIEDDKAKINLAFLRLKYSF
jgi:hypothetical protein